MCLLQSLAGRATAAFRSVLDDLVTTAFPSDCRVCSGPLLRFTILPICENCRTSVPPQTLAMCRICGEALDIDMESARFASQFMDEGLLCDDCRNRPPKFERAVAYAVYRKELREMIHLLKYERMSGVAKLLGPMLAEAILSIESVAAQDLIVVPVPLFPSKLRQRGYNQSELLAKTALAEVQRTRPDWRLSLEPDNHAPPPRHAKPVCTQPDQPLLERQRRLCGGSELHSARMRGASDRRYLHHRRDRSRVFASTAPRRSKQGLGRHAGPRPDPARSGCHVGRNSDDLSARIRIETARMGRRVQ
jgi:predicted amidophosphoribosyltransferase